MNTKLSESNGEPCTWRHVSTVRGQALENLPSKDGKALSAEPTVGLFSSAIGFITQQVKQRWYLQDMTNLEFLSELLTEKRTA